MSLKMYAVLMAMMVGTSFAGCTSPKPTPTSTSPSQSSCSEPPQREVGYPDYDTYCKCPGTYNASTPGWGNSALGLVRCDTKCVPANPSQRESHPTDWSGADLLNSLQACKDACTGSFEKAKSKRQDDDYWFCHGVNFKQGELCEFIGSLGQATFEAGSGFNCLYIDSLG